MLAKRFFNTVNIGNLITVIGVLVAVPMLVLPFYPQEAHFWYAFTIPSAVSVVLGIIIWFLLIKNEDNVSNFRINMQTGSLTVLLAWIYGFIAGAVPFIISGQLGVMHGLFEAISGWTTTGLSVMDVNTAPKIFLLHRGFMQYCGGLGFVMVMLLFTHGKQAMNLYSAEGHIDRLMPNLRKTVQIILLLYCGFVAAGIVLYRLLGMDLFDALLHSMCALSTGGFSTKLASIGQYNSMAIENVTMVLMLIGTTNFAVLLLLIKGKLKQVFRVSEPRFMVLVLLFIIPVMTWLLAGNDGMGGLRALRHASFNSISALSTTGYSTIDFDGLPQVALGIFIILMLIGGGMGSTAGGIKMSRIYVMCRIMAYSLKRRMSPTRQIDLPHYMRAQGKVSIDAATVSETTGFFLTYITVFVAGAFMIALGSGNSLLDSAFEFASALGTVGLSIGITSAQSNAMTIITLCAGMILGRLEIFIVLIGIYSGWKMSLSKISNALNRAHRK